MRADVLGGFDAFRHIEKFKAHGRYPVFPGRWFFYFACWFNPGGLARGNGNTYDVSVPPLDIWHVLLFLYHYANAKNPAQRKTLHLLPAFIYPSTRHTRCKRDKHLFCGLLSFDSRTYCDI